MFYYIINMANKQEVNMMEDNRFVRDENIGDNMMGLNAPEVSNICDIGKDCKKKWGNNCSSCMASIHYDCNKKKYESLIDNRIIDHILFDVNVEGFQNNDKSGNFGNKSFEQWNIDVDTCLRGGTSRCANGDYRLQNPQSVGELDCARNSDYEDECDQVNCNLQDQFWKQSPCDYDASCIRQRSG